MDVITALSILLGLVCSIGWLIEIGSTNQAHLKPSDSAFLRVIVAVVSMILLFSFAAYLVG